MKLFTLLFRNTQACSGLGKGKTQYSDAIALELSPPGVVRAVIEDLLTDYF